METSERFWFDPRTRTIRDENRLAVATLLLEGDADLGPAMAAATELRDAARRALALLAAKGQSRKKWTVEDQAAFEALGAALAHADGKED